MQDISPLDIQKQTFNATFRGYSVNEVRAYLHLLAEELEHLLKQSEKFSSENTLLREEVADYKDRERMLKDTLLSAQRVSEEMRNNAEKEAEIIVKEAELRAEKMIGQAMERAGEIERAIQDLKIERKALRNKLQSTLGIFEQMVALDAEEEANDLPMAHLYRKSSGQ